MTAFPEGDSRNLPTDSAYAVDGYGGIAWRIRRRYVVDHSPMEAWEEPDYDFTRVVCVMVGDDREFTFDVDELTALDEDDYCLGCGQIGCGH